MEIREEIIQKIMDVLDRRVNMETKYVVSMKFKRK